MSRRDWLITLAVIVVGLAGVWVLASLGHGG
jgi:uncharacterized membrane protein YuzA (DUF378 family)